ncbi:MAG: hypothetical protein GX386_06270 [Clostridiaceae bacterium]|jgi:hypothetical protein|nr:hypothetical protein [Clostridiaceae bacterium]
MDTMEKATKRSLLLDKGIILQSGTICRDKINLVCVKQSWAIYLFFQ